jgi:hypothetical protein
MCLAMSTKSRQVRSAGQAARTAQAAFGEDAGARRWGRKKSTDVVVRDRVAAAPSFAQIDALENITSRPFTSPVTLSGNASPQMKALAEDIDGRATASTSSPATSSTML